MKNDITLKNILEANRLAIECRVKVKKNYVGCSFHMDFFKENITFFKSLIEAYAQDSNLFITTIRKFFLENFNIVVTAILPKKSEINIFGLVPSKIEKILNFSKFMNVKTTRTLYRLMDINSMAAPISLDETKDYVNSDAVYLFEYLYKEVNPELFEDRLDTLVSLAKINSKTYDYIFNNIIDNDEDKLIFTVLK